MTLATPSQAKEQMPVRLVLGQKYGILSSRYENSCARTDRFDRNSLLLRYVGTGKKVLELGCSTGFISRRLKQSGCRVYAVEIDGTAAESARPFCQRVVVADLSEPGWELEIRERDFDVIILGDVLEHLVDPDAVLGRAIPLLSPSGRVVISLPNIVHWTQRVKFLFGHFQYGPIGLLDFTHLRFFTPTTARSLIEGAGCQIVSYQSVIGGRLTDHMRLAWQILARLLPNLFAYQMLFVAAPSPLKREGRCLPLPDESF